MNNLKRHEHFIVKYYNFFRPEQAVEQLTEIPPPYLEFISYLDYIDIIKPFVCIDLANGMTRSVVSIKYGITIAEARGIGIRIGRYTRKDG